MLKAVIFDMDGVIIDSEKIYVEVERKMFEDLGIEVKQEEHNSYTGVKLIEVWSHLKNKHGLSLSHEELVKIERTMYNRILMSRSDITPIPGVVELIKDLYENGITLALASSSAKEDIDLVIRKFELEDFFKAVISGDEVKNGKPAPDIFLLACKRIGNLPEECIVIEDSMSGVEAAGRAGIKCIGYKDPDFSSQDLSSADLIVYSLTELNYKKLLHS